MLIWARKLQRFFSGIPAGFKEADSSAHCGTYYALYTMKLEWIDAAMYCRSQHQNAHLVTITSADKQKLMAHYMKSWYTFLL